MSVTNLQSSLTLIKAFHFHLHKALVYKGFNPTQNSIAQDYMLQKTRVYHFQPSYV